MKSLLFLVIFLLFQVFKSLHKYFEEVPLLSKNKFMKELSLRRKFICQKYHQTSIKKKTRPIVIWHCIAQYLDVPMDVTGSKNGKKKCARYMIALKVTRNVPVCHLFGKLPKMAKYYIYFVELLKNKVLRMWRDQVSLPSQSLMANDIDKGLVSVSSDLHVS